MMKDFKYAVIESETRTLSRVRRGGDYKITLINKLKVNFL